MIQDLGGTVIVISRRDALCTTSSSHHFDIIQKYILIALPQIVLHIGVSDGDPKMKIVDSNHDSYL